MRVAEVLAEISEEFYDVVEGLSATDEHAEYMEARTDALDELVEMRVLPSAGCSPQGSPPDPRSDEFDVLIDQIRESHGLREAQSSGGRCTT